MDTEKRQEVAVVAVPFPSQSHLNQLLHFSLILSTRGFPIHFAAPSSSIHQAQLRLQGWDSAALQRIRFHSLFVEPSPTIPSSPSPLYHGLRLFDTPLLLRSSLASLLLSLSPSYRRLVVLHDTFMSIAGLEAASLPNAESCTTADALTTGPTAADPILTAHFEEWIPPPILARVKRLQHDTPAEAGVVVNSCRPLDRPSSTSSPRSRSSAERGVFAVWPLHLLHPLSSSEPFYDRSLRWLDAQPPASVVYVSFGSTTSMSSEQMEQLATGLRRSGQRFVWVVREADNGAIGVEDSSRIGKKDGFEDKVEGMGLVMRRWAPQLEILAHPSTGAFVSHCGWNSTVESLSAGVPIIAWPMQFDQPRSAEVLVGRWRVGVMMREWEKRKELVKAGRVEEVVRLVMESEEGKEMRERERARKMGEDVRAAAGEGGPSVIDLDSFVSHINRSIEPK
ncbi:hypothetical protein HPP92_026526 [Vanilla planifolia]|uniref:Glycosyltransferase n=1 Tax=Vanilla planifolia TaxID=51239 RepID=A0A835U970_VANPL|nr:hypothetical protein HPP92_026754 [Vanilla planifolia]KAG0450868.1 hypothetical protein HPP92_026526 [Vanilla planifolia]